ncbi:MULTISPECIES: HigA family addiction module antitoxin [unclassified Citromicrobium]|uniref:HigA family addiction module antitoxin n=1 Tax=unclassified Citromicrobium TaxID=2630544 RepID=UPI0006C8F394|nr:MULTISPECIES: HigA family addiction module antitoxin [unclassified Citromicrobium]MAO03390.1 addiction module antidote protein, HigA family [Citromicrobium sp.]MAO04354.1 addiction module antidote protein, HigA family [Citromicrobium sp.]OAM09810.1 hypothetical protein A0U43_01655 [Citromicrobium sp. RCC1897]
MRGHPGPWLKHNCIEPHRITVTAAAAHLKVTRVALSNLLNGKAALSPDMATQFENAFGIKAEALVRMQAAYDLEHIEMAQDRVSIQRVGEVG